MLVIVSAVFKQKQRLFLNSYLTSSQKRPKGASFWPFSVVFLSFSVNFAIKAERSLRRDARSVRKAARVVMKLCKAERGLPRRREAQGFFFLFPPAVPDRHTLSFSQVASVERGKAEARGEADLRALVVRGCNIEFRAQLTQEQAAQRILLRSRPDVLANARLIAQLKWKKSGANCSSIDLRSSPRSSVSPVKIMR